MPQLPPRAGGHDRHLDLRPRAQRRRLPRLPRHRPQRAQDRPHADLAPHKLCAECHLSESGSFQMPYAHRDGTRPFECTNCHSLHGDNRQGRLAMIGSGGVCLDCHTEKTGPFVYPHPPQQVNGCINCHVPHGSPNPETADPPPGGGPVSRVPHRRALVPRREPAAIPVLSELSRRSPRIQP